MDRESPGWDGGRNPVAAPWLMPSARAHRGHSPGPSGVFSTVSEQTSSDR